MSIDYASNTDRADIITGLTGDISEDLDAITRQFDDIYQQSTGGDTDLTFTDHKHAHRHLDDIRFALRGLALLAADYRTRNNR